MNDKRGISLISPFYMNLAAMRINDGTGKVDAGIIEMVRKPGDFARPFQR